MTYDRLGLLLEIVGITVILVPQIHFLWKLRKKYKTLKRGCLEIVAPRVGLNEKITDEEVEKEFSKFPLAEWVYSDLMISLIGLGITLVGLVIELLPL